MSNLSSVSSAVSQASADDAVSIAVLKKALDVEAKGALQLINALPQPMPKNPPNLGNTINTYA